MNPKVVIIIVGTIAGTAVVISFRKKILDSFKNLESVYLKSIGIPLGPLKFNFQMGGKEGLILYKRS